MRDRYRGSMPGTLVGDAFGAGFEGWDVVDRAHVDRWLAATDTLRFTDDTHMTIGLAESLLARTEAIEEVRGLADQRFARVHHA